MFAKRSCNCKVYIYQKADSLDGLETRSFLVSSLNFVLSGLEIEVEGRVW
jgi:hypothetical protein